MKEVWKCDLNFVNFCLEFLQELSIVWEAISNTRKSVSSYFQTPRSWSRNSAAPRFSNLLLGVWKSEETLFLVFDILRQIRESGQKSSNKSTPFWFEICENSSKSSNKFIPFWSEICVNGRKYRGYDRVEIRNFSSSVEKYFTSERTSEIFFTHEKEIWYLQAAM